MTPFRPSRLGIAAAALGLLAQGFATPLAAQGAIDPIVAPRAAELERAGERQAAKNYLGQYLSRSTDDAKAWLQLGKLYLLDARDWHLRGHVGEPDAALVLDFAATAFDQTLRLGDDSAAVLRALAENGRDLLRVESLGWAEWRAARAPTGLALPADVTELGLNLLASCPGGGVLLTGGDLETLAVWYATLELGRRPDLLPVLPSLYATDARYRGRIAVALGVDSALVIQRALAQVAAQRPVCLSPLADAAALPDGPRTPARLVVVLGAGDPPADQHLSFTAFVTAERAAGSVWTAELLRSYRAAAIANPILCRSLFVQLGDRPVGACGR
jgi:hypothetical protein